MPKTDTILSAKSLRYFLQLIDTMNYTQAAQILGITQPALTQQIKKLEHAIGAPLFGQTGKKLYLTEAGKEMQSAAVKLLDTINSVVDDVQEFTKSDEGHISIGILDTLDLQDFRKFLVAFNHKYPKIQLSVTSYNRKEIWRNLDNNSIDIALMYLPDNTKRDEINLQHQYDHIDVLDDRLVILTHKDTVEKEKEYPISRFSRRKWVSYPNNFYVTQLMKEYFGHKTSPSVAISFSRAKDLVATAQETEYDTYVTESYYESHKDEIKLTPVYIKEDKRFKVAIVYRKGKLEIPRVKNFLKEWKNFLDK